MRDRGMILLLLLLATVAVAQHEAAPVIREVRIDNTGRGPLDHAFVAAQIESEVGSRLDRAVVSRDVRALLDTDRFSYVAVEVEPLDEAARVIFVLQNKFRLHAPIRFEGVEHFRRKKLQDLFEVRVGGLVDEQIIGTAARNLEKEYRKALYPAARVRYELIPLEAPDGWAEVTVIVEEGRRAKVSSVNFTGNQVVEDRELWRIVEPRNWWNPMRWFSRRRYDPLEFDAYRGQMLQLYQDRGYLASQISAPLVQSEARGLAVTYQVEEGALYRYGDIQLSGVTLFPELELRRLIVIERGAPASAARLRQTVQALEDYYGSRGYLNTMVRTVRTADEDQRILHIEFHVQEGVLTRIRNIRIRGNMRTRDAVIRRELLVYPGEIYDEVRIRNSERIVSNLGFFSTVRTRPVPTGIEDSRDLLLDVEEKRTGQFMVGAGFSSVDKVSAFLELSQGNFDLFGWPYFTGGGQKLKLRSQFGTTRNLYELSFVEPWFLRRKLSLGLDLYQSKVGYSDYDLQKTGFAISLGRALPGPNRIHLQYRLERQVLSDVSDTNLYVYIDNPADEYSFEREEDFTKSSLRLTLTHDVRDNPFVPTRGQRMVAYGELTGGPLGFDTDIYELGFRTTHYVPLWFGHVFNFRTRMAVVDTYGETEEVPIGDRMFMGGGRTLRGFKYRDVGPKVRLADQQEDDRYHKHVGGRSLAMANVEYTIPLISGLRLAFFYDIGNVWREAYTYHFDNMASSAGIGLRLDVPGFPVRVDRGWVLDADSPYTDEDAWVIWIGFDQ